LSTKNNYIDRILCAAVHFLDLPPSTISKSINIDRGLVITGRRHCDCYATLFALTSQETIDSAGDDVQGFLTASNRFVDRFEAFEIAKNAEQLLPQVDRSGNLLISEMLYLDDEYC
jgi:hypothetical protein